MILFNIERTFYLANCLMKISKVKANWSQGTCNDEHTLSSYHNYQWPTTIFSDNLHTIDTYCLSVSYSGLVTLWLHWLKLLSVLPHSPSTFCLHLILTNRTENEILLRLITWTITSCDISNGNNRFPNCTMSTKNINWRHQAPGPLNLDNFYKRNIYQKVVWKWDWDQVTLLNF